MTRSSTPLFTAETAERDAQWVQAIRAGHAKTFERLVEAYERPGIATAYRLLGNSHDAQEVVQEAFLRAYRSLDRLKEPSRFGPWFLRIVSNLSLNARRSRRSGTTVTLDEQWGADGATNTHGETAVTTFSPDRGVEGKELGRALEAALATLPDKQRVALVLFAIEGWAQKDIAALLECSLENVKWYVFQGRKKLRDRLGDVMPD